MVQGTTARGGGNATPGSAAAHSETAAFDLRLFGSLPVGSVLARWGLLREATGCSHAVHAFQVHGTTLLVHQAGPPGLFIADDADAHATTTPGVLLTVSAADCIPISLVDPERRALALLHGGWRGVAAGVVEAGIAALGDLAGSAPADLFVHLGPAICGACYEVGPEVHLALGLEAPRDNRPVDLRAVAARRAVGLGVDPERISSSAHCTRCEGSPFFSHRAGCPERQVGVLGLRPGEIG